MTDITKTEEECTALATPAIDFEADAGAGTEEVDQQSRAIPFITLLQGLSPQLELIDAAKPGMIFNTVTEACVRELLVIPCHFRRTYIEWAKDRGGYVKEHSPVDVDGGALETVVDDDGKLKLGENDLTDTRNHYVLYYDVANERWAPAMLGMSSSKIKVSKRWISRITSIEQKNSAGKSFNPASFSHLYKITTVKETGKKGEYYNYSIALVGEVTDADVYRMARDFHAAVKAGEVKESTPVPEDGSGVVQGTVDEDTF